ncbi:hypothetical protein GCM10009117_23530 [Gangjinia marincola]|uniref:Uncharacterized protein n=1 Tax=Gangjinia marincola TaxID=578463 RepID=A0ABN1MK14_9FLAO
MINNKIVFVLSFFFVVAKTNAQQFRGVIVADSIEKVEINIVNITKQLGTTNNQQGEFSLAAEDGDRILFSSLPYETYEIKVTSAMLSAPRNVIYLAPKVNELPEVKLNKYGLSGNLGDDIAALPPAITPGTLGLPQRTKPVPTQAERRLYTATTSSGGVPLDLLINIISGRLKMLKKVLENERQQTLVIRSRQAFPEGYFKEQYELKEEQVDEFLYFCAKDKDLNKYLRFQNVLALIEFFDAKIEPYREYLKS